MITPPEVFKSLSDETRARATLLITSLGELCACELVCALDDSQPKISRHLAQLRSCGLLLDRRQGQWVYYRTACLGARDAAGHPVGQRAVASRQHPPPAEHGRPPRP